MSLLVASCSSSNPITPPTNSLKMKYQDLLTSLLGKENMERVKELPKDSFDSLLWQTLASEGAKQFHWFMHEEITPGYLWIQEEEYEPKLIILWSTENGCIYSAYYQKENEEENQITLEFYMVRSLHLSYSIRKTSLELFQALISKYLAQYENPNEPKSQPLAARQFQRQLELIPIIFQATQSACAKFAQIGTKFGSELSVVLGVDGEDGERFNPRECQGVDLAAISKYFLAGRFTFLHDQEGKPEHTSEPVAPVMRTKEAYRELRKLRKVELESGKELGIYTLEEERLVPKIMKERAVADKSLHDLRIWLTLLIGGIKFEAHEFQLIEPKRRAAQESIKLFVDFQNDTWKLQSQLTQKI